MPRPSSSRPQAAARKNPSSALNQLAGSQQAISLDLICQALQANDPISLQIVQAVGRYLAMALANLVSVLGVRRILIAGSVACLGQPLLDVIQAELGDRSLEMIAREIQVDLSDMGSSMVVLGASALVLDHELGLFVPLANGLQ